MSKTTVTVNDVPRKNLFLKELSIRFDSAGKEVFHWEFNRKNIRVKGGDRVKVYYGDYLLLDAVVEKHNRKIEFLDKARLQLTRIP